MAMLAVLYIPAVQQKPEQSDTEDDSPNHIVRKAELKPSESGNFKVVDNDSSVPLVNTDEDTPLLPKDPVRASSISSTSDVGIRFTATAVGPGDDSTPEEKADSNQVGSAPSSNEKPTEETDGNEGDSTNKATSDQDRDAACVPDEPTGVRFIVQAVDDDEQVPLEVEEFSLVEAVQVVLEELGVETDVWREAMDGDFLQVSFVMLTAQCDKVLKRLSQLGIGRIQDTSISLFPANFHEGEITSGSSPKNAKDSMTTQEPDSNKTEEKKSKFIKSISSRLIVAQVVDNVKSNAILTFDFLMFVILASMIAAVGLAENSSVILVASMLVSPIMGPILGGTFGLVVGHNSLCRLGVKNEIISLAICIASGFVIGLITAAANLNGTFWGSTDSWPTAEMRSRGLLRGLWVGILIALPSGAGVALSVLGGNAGSLVGVAISASLLPPAVNAGMLWAYALLTSFKPPSFTRDLIVRSTVAPDTITYVNGGGVVNFTTEEPIASYPTPPNCPPLEDNEYEFVYSCYMPHEAAILGAVSLFLTILNILCIFIMGVVFLKIKEVAPDIAVSEYTSAFWKNDIKVARENYTTIKASSDVTSSTGVYAKKLAAVYQNTIFPHLTQQSDTIGTNDSHKFILNNICGNRRPPFLRLHSVTTDNVFITDNTPHHHTFHGLNQKPFTPETPTVPTFDLDESPFSTAPSTIHHRRGIFRSPAGTQEFLFDQSAMDRRKKRASFIESRYKHLSLPHGLKFPEGIDGMTRNESGRFKITPVKEEDASQ